MTRHAAAKLFLVGSLAAGFAPRLPAIDPDPSKLAPTREQATRAQELVAKLGDPVFRIRDDATRELRKLGRAALPVLNDTLNTTPDPEVRVRCETLLPAIETADLKARLAAFVSDADGKYDHKLPGWGAFRTITGNTADARTLFADACQSKDNVEVLQALGSPKEELEKVVLNRRMLLYNQSVRYSPNGVRTPARTGDVVTLLFAEATVSIANRNYSYAITNLLSQPTVREAVTAETGEPFRKLLAHWMDSRTNYLEIYQAMNLAGQLNLKDIPVTKYAEKVLATETSPVIYRMYALTTTARVVGADGLPTLAKAMDDKTKYAVNWIVNNQRTVHEVQVRDIALVMSLLVTKQKPEDYGVEVKNLTAQNLNDALKFSYMYYAFADDKARDAAFAKWKQYQAKQPNPAKK
ncbi:hypothetical protein [Limnoglobus roseus]|uniref:HEAT repeat domain-containing protein n=1 Tax=Limnoglobus roseus TaxID=2598579 RepID=A0A5C1A9F6_9BACT|nr:hypothetical protein [Limnoglobus roseus]QEL15831.1 HEAT repeat domain-containing protein [Limnoglobus roseus]